MKLSRFEKLMQVGATLDIALCAFMALFAGILAVADFKIGMVFNAVLWTVAFVIWLVNLGLSVATRRLMND